MSHSHRTRTIKVSHDRVWPLIEDFGAVHRFNPFIRKATATSTPGTCAVGDTRRCEFYNDSAFVEEEITSIDPGRSITIKLTAGTMPFTTATAVIEAIPVDREITKLGMNMKYKAKGGVLSPIIGLAMKPVMFFMLGKMLKSFEQHLETGQAVGKNGKLIAA